MLLFDNLPGWNALRTSGRLVLWAMVPLALLAAGAVSEFVRRSHALARTRVPTWPGPWLRFASLVPLLLVTVEGLQQQDFPVAPPQPAAMRTVDGPMLVLPTDDIADMHAVLWTTTKFQQVTNGSSSFTPPGLRELREVSKSFPDPASVAALRERGVTTVVLLRDKVGGTPWERAADVAVDDLGIQREDLPDAVVFRL
jgi:hypothetical protein